MPASHSDPAYAYYRTNSRNSLHMYDEAAYGLEALSSRCPKPPNGSLDTTATTKGGYLRG